MTNQNHKVLRQYSDSPDDGLIVLCRRLRDESEVMRIVDPYPDTMFNRFQQIMLREELNALLTGSTLAPAEIPVARSLLDAVDEAYEIGGYVKILAE